MSCPSVEISAVVTPIELRPAPGVTGILDATFVGAVSGTLVAGDVVYLTGGSTGGFPDVARVTLSIGATMPPVGVVMATDGTTTTIRYSGPTGSLYTGLAAGAPVYAKSGGGVTQAATTTSGEYIAEIGIASSATDVLVILRPPMRRA